MAGLMKRVPQYYALGWGGDVEFRDFETMDEIARTQVILEEITAAAETCFRDLGIPRPTDAQLETDRVFAGGIEEIDLRSLFATGFVNFALRGKFDIRPLDREDIRKAFEIVLEEDPSGGRRLKQDTVDRFLVWLKQASGRTGPLWTPLVRFAGKALAALGEEMRQVLSWTDLDPRYVRSVILTKSS
jgi:hypothetical protein